MKVHAIVHHRVCGLVVQFSDGFSSLTDTKSPLSHCYEIVVEFILYSTRFSTYTRSQVQTHISVFLPPRVVCDIRESSK